jgi:hypothetical protein
MYIAGLGANLYQQEFIFSSMLGYRRFPDDLFAGSQERLDIVRGLLR